MKNFLSICLAVAFLALSGCSDKNVTSLTHWVDPYIGTGGHGHTFLGVAAPFGALQLGPTNINKGWDWCSGYHYSDSVLIGFSHLHLNGTGCCDSGDLLFMPYTGEMKKIAGTQENPTSGYGSHYSHDREKARVGYYSVMLDDSDVLVELTATERVGYHRYTFPKEPGGKQLMIDLKNGYGDDRTLESFIEQTDEYTVSGYRFSTGWSKGVQQIYFTAKFSLPVSVILLNDTAEVSGKSLKAQGVKANVRFADDVEDVQVKVGISPVSIENAAQNIVSEIPEWNFEQVVAQTTDAWEKELSKVVVETNDTVAKRIFYTGMYHAFLQPVLFNDVNNDYKGADRQVYSNAPFKNYTVFSLWDTYRAAHPLYTILQPERVSDFVKSMLAIFDQKGCLPVWHLYGSDTYEMIGIQSVPVIADAILKGYNTFNYEQAYNAMKQSMLSDYKGLNFVRENEYIPADKEGESVAKGLEYALADWSVAQVAKKLGKEDDYRLFMERAGYYRHYWDPSVRFFRGKNADGSWRDGFNPFRSEHRADDYCEGNAWQYAWLVPHDVEGLIKLMGGEEAFVQKLDSLFVLNESMGEKASGDISGLIGQYAHGNEPGHHITYLYTLAGQQWKTAEKVRYILKNMYSDQPDGLQGNEDCGQMSSWYIFSALGFYPVVPAGGDYILGSPLFDKAEISLPEGKSFKIIALNNVPANKYIQSVKLNGKPYEKAWISHEDIMQGGVLELTMGNVPEKSFGVKKQELLYTKSEIQ